VKLLKRSLSAVVAILRIVARHKVVEVAALGSKYRLQRKMLIESPDPEPKLIENVPLVVKKRNDNDKTLSEHSFTKRALRLRQWKRIETLLRGDSARTGSTGPTSVASCARLAWDYRYCYLHDVGQPLFFSIRDHAASACDCLGSPTMAI
jgi:hypothetical protein